MKLIPESGHGGQWKFLWVVDPPLFEYDEDSNQETYQKVIQEFDAKTSAFGVIKEILVKDGSPVEYGQPLFAIA